MMNFKGVTVFVLWLLVYLLAACGGGPAFPEAGDLIGVWQQGNDLIYIEFLGDGTFRTADSTANLARDPFDSGRYEVEDGTLRLISEADSIACSGHTGVYQVQFNDGGAMELTRIEETCPARQADPIPPWNPVTS